jgi:hypothetical protein
LQGFLFFMRTAVLPQDAGTGTMIAESIQSTRKVASANPSDTPPGTAEKSGSQEFQATNHQQRKTL